MYVTGGFGPSASNEGFTSDYDLPNDTAYAETCASVAFIFWAQRMLNLELDGRYADLLERALYNGALSGLSRDGENYFYENKLESDGSHRRWAWHPCPCCTMNVSRLVASIGGYFYSTGPAIVAVHLYGGNAATLEVDGKPVTITEESRYPWSGRIRLTVEPGGAAALQPAPAHPRLGRGRDRRGQRRGRSTSRRRPTRGYLDLDRDWAPGDVVELDLPMPPARIFANPKVREDLGKVALRRGPLVYCLEQADNGRPRSRSSRCRATPPSPPRSARPLRRHRRDDRAAAPPSPATGTATSTAAPRRRPRPRPSPPSPTTSGPTASPGRWRSGCARAEGHAARRPRAPRTSASAPSR